MESPLEDEQNTGKLNAIVSDWKGSPDALIEVLRQSQEAFEYIPEELLAK